MNDYDETEQMGCFVNIIFIIVELVIGYMMISTSGDKTEFIAIILISYFIYKAIKNSISKI